MLNQQIAIPKTNQVVLVMVTFCFTFISVAETFTLIKISEKEKWCHFY